MEKVKYVYAITDDREEHHFGRIGIDEAPVYTLIQGALAAVVSDMQMGKVRPERKRLSAHHRVVSRLMSAHAVLPAVFGTIAPRHSIIAMLKKNQGAFLRQLKHVDGRVEMGLNVSWSAPNIFEYFVARHPELSAFRDEIFSGKESRAKKIELGKFFEDILNRDRQKHAEAIRKALSRLCIEIRQNKPRNEKEIVRLACLIGKEDVGQFEAAVSNVAGLFDDGYTFDYSGPWCPYNFVGELKPEEE